MDSSRNSTKYNLCKASRYIFNFNEKHKKNALHCTWQASAKLAKLN